MKRKITLIEILVAISIGLIIIALLFLGISGIEPNTTTSPKYNAFLYPEQAKAQAAQEQVEALKEQNRLMRELLEKNSNK